MARPSDWFVLDLDRDPTPGDPERVEALSGRFLDFAEVSERAYRSVTSLQGDSAIMSWVGLSGEAFREQFGGFPDQLRKLYTSHQMAGDALVSYAPQLTAAQAQADRALADGREARAQLSSVSAALTTAKAAATGAAGYAEQIKNPGNGSPAPDPAQVAQAVRDAQTAQSTETTAQGAVDSAQAALDAAKSLAEQAREMRASAAGACAQKIDEASDAGIAPRSFWQKLGEFFKQLWDIICEVAKWVALVAGIIAMIIGGPLAWVALAAGAILLIKAVVDFAQGKGSVMDLVFGILGVIPGVKGLTTLARLKELYRAGGLKAIGQAALANARSFLPALANVVKNGNAGTFIQKVFVAPFRSSDDIAGAGADVGRGLPDETTPLLETPDIPAGAATPPIHPDPIPPTHPVPPTEPVPSAHPVPSTHAVPEAHAADTPPAGAADDAVPAAAEPPPPVIAPLPAPSPGKWRPRKRPESHAPPEGSNVAPDSTTWTGADALTRFLGGGAVPLNRFLRGLPGPRFDPPAVLTENARVLSSRLDELPPIDSTTFRGIEGDLGLKLDGTALKVGDSWSDPAFMSTSVNADKANEFIATGGKLDGVNTSGVGTLFNITGKSGRDVQGFTGLGEGEILFNQGTQFKVTGISSSFTEMTINGQTIKVRVIDLLDETPSSG